MKDFKDSKYGMAELKNERGGCLVYFTCIVNSKCKLSTGAPNRLFTKGVGPLSLSLSLSLSFLFFFGVALFKVFRSKQFLKNQSLVFFYALI